MTGPVIIQRNGIVIWGANLHFLNDDSPIQQNSLNSLNLSWFVLFFFFFLFIVVVVLLVVVIFKRKNDIAWLSCLNWIIRIGDRRYIEDQCHTLIPWNVNYHTLQLYTLHIQRKKQIPSQIGQNWPAVNLQIASWRGLIDWVFGPKLNHVPVALSLFTLQRALLRPDVTQDPTPLRVAEQHVRSAQDCLKRSLHRDPASFWTIKHLGETAHGVRMEDPDQGDLFLRLHADWHACYCQGLDFEAMFGYG